MYLCNSLETYLNLSLAWCCDYPFGILPNWIYKDEIKQTLNKTVKCSKKKPTLDKQEKLIEINTLLGRVLHGERNAEGESCSIVVGIKQGLSVRRVIYCVVPRKNEKQTASVTTCVKIQVSTLRSEKQTYCCRKHWMRLLKSSVQK